MAQTVTMDKIVAFSSRRRFVYQSSEIYGGIRSSYDYGPLGVEMKRNIKEEWWRRMVHMREDMVGLDSAIIMHPKVWEASGHTLTFNDMLVESRTSKRRYRADHLIEGATGIDAEGLSPEQLTKIIQEDDRVKDPVDGGRDFAPVRPFNLMFETYMGPVKTPENLAYLRPETAQGIFVNFKNVLQTSRVKVPFGIAQIGKSFRNEITPGNFIFRTREFEQMEMEFFVKPGTDAEWHEYWIEERFNWYLNLGMIEENLRKREQTDDERAHYATRRVVGARRHRQPHRLRPQKTPGVLGGEPRVLRPGDRRELRALRRGAGRRPRPRDARLPGGRLHRGRGPRRGAHRPQAPPAHRPGEGCCVPTLQKRTRLDGGQEALRRPQGRVPPVLRRLGLYRAPLQAPGRGRHAFLRDGGLRHVRRQEGHHPRQGHDGAGTDPHRGRPGEA